MTPALARALAVAHLGLAVLDLEAEAKERAPAPRGGRELANPFGLPAGGPIRRALVRFFRRQLARVLGGLPRDPLAEVPAAFDVTGWTDEMADAMTPVLRPYWDEGGKRLYAEVGLDPKSWEVTSPALAPVIREQSFWFSRSMNEKTTLDLQSAHAELRKALEEGLVEKGESLDLLTKRVRGIYRDAETWRARRVAATESSRAIHQAGLEAARESGVVRGKRLLISSDSCGICRKVKASEPAGGWPLDATMYDDGGGHEYYSKVPCTPLHVHCQCTLTWVLSEEFAGEDEG